jgi:hypothetical protein
VTFVDEDDGPESALAIRFDRLNDSAQRANTFASAAKLCEPLSNGLRKQARNGCLANPGRAPEDD